MLRKSMHFSAIGMLILVVSLIGAVSFTQASTVPKIINAQIAFWKPSDNDHPAFEDVMIVGTFAYISDADLPGLRILSVANPANPVLIASAPTEHTTYKIVVQHEIAYLRGLNASAPIEYFNVDDPASPVKLTGFPTGFVISDFIAIGDIIYATNNGNLLLFNITQPTAITLIQNFTLGQADSLGCNDNFLFITNDTGDTNEILIYDITDAVNPVFAGRTEIGHLYVNEFEVYDDFLYLSGRDYALPTGNGGTIKTIHVANFSEPEVVNTLVTDGISASGMARLGNTLYTGACKQGLVYINLEDPTNPSIIGHFIEYQTEYCGGEYYAQYPTIVTSAGHNYLMFVSINCGFHVLSLDTLQFSSTSTSSETGGIEDLLGSIGIDNIWLYPCIFAGTLMIILIKRKEIN